MGVLDVFLTKQKGELYLYIIAVDSLWPKVVLFIRCCCRTKEKPNSFPDFRRNFRFEEMEATGYPGRFRRLRGSLPPGIQLAQTMLSAASEEEKQVPWALAGR